MLIKVCAKDREGKQKYSPPEVVETVTKTVIGDPDPSRICTSIVERSNLSMRTSIRRLPRLTNAFSKKWENLKAMLRFIPLITISAGFILLFVALRKWKAGLLNTFGGCGIYCLRCR
jgi:hypothetical protein